jgi:hypothetical protein
MARCRRTPVTSASRSTIDGRDRELLGDPGYGDPIDGGTVFSMPGTRSTTTLTEVGHFADQPAELELGPPVDPLGRQVAAAGSAAVGHARRRLASRLPTRALQAADQYFPTPDVNTWDGGLRPRADVDVHQLVPPDRSATADRGVELSEFDRRYPAWAPFADDVAAVTGADVVLELLVADDDRRVTGWRRDESDVMVTVIEGAERFTVATTEPPDAEPEPELDTVLRAGDALRLPRSMLHAACPDVGGSTVLTMKLRRATDWSLGRSAPSHLGFREYPRSARVYRLCLRSHVPATPPPTSADWDLGTILRTRAPGGLALLAVRGTDVTFVAAGSVYRASKPVLRVLTAIHAGDGIRMPDVVEVTTLSSRTVRSAIDGLLGSGLVRVDRPTPSGAEAD